MFSNENTRKWYGDDKFLPRSSFLELRNQIIKAWTAKYESLLQDRVKLRRIVGEQLRKTKQKIIFIW